MFGKSHSVETRKKISQAINGPNHPMFGKKYSPERREKMKLSRMKYLDARRKAKQQAMVLAGAA